MAAFFFFINAGLTISEKKKKNYFEIKNYIKYKQDI